MDQMIPAGAVALDATQLAMVNGGGIWDGLLTAATFGFKAGQWVWCAIECIWIDG